MSKTGIDITQKKHNIDKVKLQRLLPKGSSHKVTDEIINTIGLMETHTGLFQDYMEESLLSHLPVLREIKVDLIDYINAIKYCNLKRNMTNEKAWEIVFPEKFKRLYDSGKQISNHVAMYNSSKIVVKLDASMMIDIKIQYAPVLHQAIRKEVSIMTNDEVSFHVQHLAAKTLIETLVPLEEQKVDIKIGPSDDAKAHNEKMFGEMRKIAENQQELLRQGHSLEDIQRLNLKIEVEEDDGDDEYAEIIEETSDEYADDFESRLGFQGN
jgi:hypothetical protein